MPRQEAKKIISLNNVNRQEFSYTISLEIMNSMKEEFLKWINAWKYGKGDSDLKSEKFHIIQNKILIKRLRKFYIKSKIINKIINVNI